MTKKRPSSQLKLDLFITISQECLTETLGSNYVALTNTQVLGSVHQV